MIDIDRIREGIDLGRAKGWLASPAMGYSRNRCGCALHVAAIGLGLVPAERDFSWLGAARALGIPVAEAELFALGFDGDPSRLSYHHEDTYKVGQSIRAYYGL